MNGAAPRLRTAWSLLRPHWATFVTAELAIFAAWVILEIAIVSLHRLNLPVPIGGAAWLVLHLAFLWLFSGLIAGIQAMALQAVDGGRPAGSDVVSRLSSGRSFLVALSVYWVAVVAGLCLVIVPGVVVAVRWALFGQILASEPSSARVALQKAASLSMHHRWPLFRLVLKTVVLNIAGAALLGIGLLVAFPVTVLLTAQVFRTLQAAPNSVLASA